MDREEKEIKGKNLEGIVPKEQILFDLEEIPEAEMMDYDNEKAQIIMYSKWDKVFDWFRRLTKKIDKW